VAVNLAIETKDWSELVDIVLRGEADLLLGKLSEDKEVQEFINNANIFKTKVQKIHDAVKSGSLKVLQEHLDRRKFCMARDLNTNINILQKAIILGHQQIFRYLTSNFQELINLRDARGRTALHYAAALQDNNYIYKTLINRGADTSAKDQSGKTPGHYNKNKKLLNKAMLINYMEGASVSDKITNNNKSSEKKDSSNTVAPLKSRLLTAILRKSRAEKTELFTENLDSDQVQKIENIYEMLNVRNDKTRINPERSLLKIPVDREIFDRVKVRVSSMSRGTLLDVLDLCQHLTDLIFIIVITCLS